MTHLERIKCVYPFLYATTVRANRKWLGTESARGRGTLFLTILEFTFLALCAAHTGLLPWWRAASEGRDWVNWLSVAALCVVMLGIDRANDYFLIKRGIGVRFERRLKTLSTADTIWLHCYGAVFALLCFSPIIGLPNHP